MIGARRPILAVVVFGLAFAVPMCVTLALTGTCEADTDARKPITHRLALQVNSDDPTVMKHAITNALNAIASYRETHEAVAIEIVAYGAGVHMFRADTSPVKGLLQLLRSNQPDVVFSVCGNTKAIMETNEGHPLSLVDGARVVPAGVVRLVELQEAGWSYLRP